MSIKHSTEIIVFSTLLAVLELSNSNGRHIGSLEGSPYREVKPPTVEIFPEELFKQDNLSKPSKKKFPEADSFLDDLVEEEIKIWQNCIDWKTNRLLIDGVSEWVYRTSAYSDIIQEAASKFDIPYNFLFALLAWESKGYSRVESGTGPAGIAQLTRAMARRAGLIINRFIDERLDPGKAIHTAAFLIRDALDRYGDESVLLICADYSMGAPKVKKAIEENEGKIDENLFYKLTPEAREHYYGVIGIQRVLSNPEKYNFSFKQKSSYRQLITNSRVHRVRPGETFERIRGMYGISHAHAIYKNPEIVDYNRIRAGHRIKM